MLLSRVIRPYEGVMGNTPDEEASEYFFDFLRHSRHKLTYERRAVLHACLTIARKHFSPDDLVQHLRDRGEHMARSTVYRVIPLLVESGILREVIYNDRHAHYEKVYGEEHHEHLVCGRCAKVIEFTDEPMEQRVEIICANHKFTPTSHKMEIIGVCEDCQAIENN